MARRGWYAYSRPKLGETFASFRRRSSTLSLSTPRRLSLRSSWVRQAYGSMCRGGPEQVSAMPSSRLQSLGDPEPTSLTRSELDAADHAGDVRRELTDR